MSRFEPLGAFKTRRKTGRQGAERKYQRSTDPERDSPSILTIIGVYLSFAIILMLVFNFVFEGSIVALILLLILFVIPLPIYIAIRVSKIDKDLHPDLKKFEGSEQIDSRDINKYTK
jgi:hypothetical protein